jgi:hypothetical protein
MAEKIDARIVYDETAAKMRDTFFDTYGKDNVAALHAAYDLITYLEDQGY